MITFFKVTELLSDTIGRMLTKVRSLEINCQNKKRNIFMRNFLESAIILSIKCDDELFYSLYIK